MDTSKNVIILGASDKEDRYAYRALKLLVRKGHSVFPVNPNLESIEEIPVYKNMLDVKRKN